VDGNPADRLRRLLSERRAEILALARRHGAYDVCLFGSVARGDAGGSSDVDLLVTFEADRSLLDQVGLQQDLADLLGVPVDVVSRGGLSPYIRADVLREAVPV
jgi:predicted nucleotidyltransferase